MNRKLTISPTKSLATFWRESCLLGALWIVLTSVARCGAQETILITFDEPPQPPGTGKLVQEYYESSIWFRPLGEMEPGNGFIRQGGNITSPENGTTYLKAGLGDSLTFSFVDDYTTATTFDLVSVDLAEYSTVVPDAVTVPFVGYKEDGTSVTAYFTTDGLIDGTGPEADFQTFYFGPEFSGLTRVEIPTYGWSLDNLVITAVPEPATVFLLIAGVLSLVICKRQH